MTRARRILVTGAGGYIGSALTPALAARDFDVVPLSRSGSGTRPLARLIEDDALFDEVAAGADVAIHLAWQTQYRGGSDADNEANGRLDIAFAERFSELCRNAGIAHFIFASSAGAVYSGVAPENGYTEDCPVAGMSVYGRTKLAVEQVLLQRSGNDTGFQAHILRITTPYGPGARRNRSIGVVNNFVEAALAGRPLEIFGDGTNRRDFIYIEDLTDMIVRFIGALPDTSSIWNIGSNQTASVNDVAELIEDLIGRRLHRNYTTADAGPATVRIDASRFLDAFRYRPRFSLRDGIAALIEDMKK